MTLALVLTLLGYLALIAWIVLGALTAISAHDEGRGYGRSMLLGVIWPASAVLIAARHVLRAARGRMASRMAEGSPRSQSLPTALLIASLALSLSAGIAGAVDLSPADERALAAVSDTGPMTGDQLAWTAIAACLLGMLCGVAFGGRSE